MFERAALIHYHEIGLKGRNRPTFERRLAANIASAIKGLSDAPVERITSRLIVRGLDHDRVDAVCEAAALQPGVGYVAAVYVTSREEHDLNRAALEAIREVPDASTFAVDSRRSSTDHAVSSMDMNRIIGQHVVDETGLAVHLDAPDVTAWVEVVGGEAFVFSRKYPGPGGLPVGSAGKVVTLLSSGIDSPVAAWRMMKRGAVVVGVHFSGEPHTTDASVRLSHEIAQRLERYGGIARIYVVPFGDLQKEISLGAPPDLRILLYRRLMVRVAEAVAAFENAKALATGESLGQVASQTLENIAVTDEAASLPVLRPLIGLDKLEIIEQARAIGTYDISTQSHEDCCTLFMPRTPETHAQIAEVLAAEEPLDIERMVSEALEKTTYREYRCAAYKTPHEMPESIHRIDG